MVAGMQQRPDERGDGLATFDEFGRWTWREFNGRVNQSIQGFRGLGLELELELENSGATVVVGGPVENLGKLELLLSPYRLSEFEGKVVLCNAPPCRRTSPDC